MKMWETAFDFTGLATSKYTFNGMLDLDGVAACFHFKCMKTDEELAAIAEAKLKSQESKQETSARKRAREADPEGAEAQLKAERAARAKAKKELAREKKDLRDSGAEVAEEEYKPPDIKEGVSSTDPGTSPNLLYTIYKKDGVVKKTRLTIGQYYTDSGVRKLARTTQKLMKQIRPAQQHMDAASYRTASLSEFCQYLTRYKAVYDVLWKQKLRRVWARGRFRTYIGKPKALDAYYRKLKLDGAGIRKAYIGGGKWSPSQRGRETGPVDLVSRRFRRYHRRWVPKSVTWRDGVCTVAPGRLACHAKTIDENLTTQCCWRCGKRTLQVYERVEHDEDVRELNKRNKEDWKNDKMVRGLRFCDSKACGCLIDRDFQGAMNIMACGEAEDGGRARPPHMTSESKAMKRTQRFFLPSASARQARREYRIEAHDNLAYSNHPDINVYRLELLLESCPVCF
jgi:hypothetical protein